MNTTAQSQTLRRNDRSRGRFQAPAKQRAGLSLRGSSLYVIFFLWAVVSLERCPADTITLLPSADSYIKDDAPDSNLNGDGALFAGMTAATTREIRRSFLQFDLSQVPPGAVIESVTLTIVVTRVPPAPADSFFDLRKVLQPWDETQVTWNSRFTGTPWEIAGADDSSDTVTTPSSTVQILDPVGPYTFPSTPQLVADVQGWVNNPADNNGWLLIGEDETTLKSARRIAAREETDNAPQLTINYIIPALDVTVTPPSQEVLVGSTVTFHANGNGVPPLSYQWQFDSAGIPGATTDTLILDNVQTNESGAYAVVLTTGFGAITSAPAILTVSPPSPGLPVVNITSPTNGSRFAAHSDILLSAGASETNGVISRVDFLLGSNLVGSATSAPYQILLTNVAAGNYVLTVRAIDERGTNGNSPSLFFSVFNPPTIDLISPNPGARSPLGTNLNLSATVAGGARITLVEFLAAALNTSSGLFETNVIGVDTNAPFTLTWLPGSAGDYFLSARVTDELGQHALSSNVFVRVFIPELVLPTITLTSGPKDFATVTDGMVDFAGAAADNIGLDHIEYQVFSGQFLQTAGPVIIAKGTTSWSASVMLAPGPNAIRFRSVDLAGNKSASITRNVSFSAEGEITVEINGEGKVTPELNGRALVLGRTYHLRATPGKSSIFEGWSGSTTSSNPRLSFQMSTNQHLVANFVPNPFPPLTGSYAGLFFDPDPLRFRPENSGSFALTLTRRGAFTGRVQVQGRRQSFHGNFDASGYAKIGIPRRGLSPLALTLQLDLTNQTDRLTGSVVIQVDANALSSPLTAVRKAPGNGNVPPYRGAASFALWAASDSSAQEGTLLANVSASGRVRLSGTLNLSGKFKTSTIISTSGDVPCWVSLKSGASTLLGWLLLDSSNSNPAQLFFVPPRATEALVIIAAPN